MLEAARRIADCGLRIADFGTSDLLNNPDPELSFAELTPLNESAAIRNPQSAIAACEAHRRQGNPQFVLPLASTITRNQVAAMIAQTADAPPVALVEQDTYNALFHAAFAIVASGTATVETALAGTPMVIVYRASPLNWHLLHPLIRLDTFGMVNLIAGRRIVPEL